MSPRVTAPKPPSVPRPRLLIQGDQGKDVIAVKRALSHAGYIEWGAFTDIYGQYMNTAISNFERDNGITPVGRGYGPKVHQKLEATHVKGDPSKWSFQPYEINLMRQEAALLKASPEQRVRGGIVAAGFYWYANRARIPYSEWRPFDLVKPPDLPSHPWDCSAYVTNCHYAGGAPDPNGRGYNNQGYTGTLMSQGTRCQLSDLKPGDLVFYGFSSGGGLAFPSGSPTHVALFTGYQGGTAMVLSNGRYPMSYTSLYYRSDVNHFRTYDVVA